MPELNQHRELLASFTPPRTLAVLDKFRNHYARLAKELAQPPLTLLHVNFYPGCLRFSTATRLPTVAAYDWQFVCRGRGSFDFAMFLGRFAPPELRAECDMELMMRYLMARGVAGCEAREQFRREVRAGLLVAFAVFFISMASKITAESADPAIVALEWFVMAIEAWDCAESVGGVDVEKPPPKKRKYLKKSKRTNRPPSPKKEKKKKEDGTLQVLGRRASAYDKDLVIEKGTFGHVHGGTGALHPDLQAKIRK